jgi:pimeloyl-ACP methyl ester carboxylesterase
MSELREGRVAANELELPTLEAGPPDGPLVLCLHGFPDTRHSWRHLLPALGDAGWRAVAPAMRGYAASAIPKQGGYALADLARDALAVVEALGAESTVLVGHDWGAATASGAAILAPGRVRKLVTMSVPHGTFGRALFTDWVQQKRSWYMFLFQLPIAEMLVSAGDFAFLERLWEDWSPGYRMDDADRAALKATFAEPGVLSAALGYYRSALSAPPTDPVVVADQARMGEPVSVEALHLHGEDDGCIGSEVCQGMEAFFQAGLRKLVLEDAGHFLQLEQPERVRREVLDFLGPA